MSFNSKNISSVARWVDVVDDKALVVVAVVIICVISIWAPQNIVSNALSGLFGVAVGRSAGNGGN
jgi:hypothetical protein